MTKDTILLTGFPAFTAKRLYLELVPRCERIFLLVQDKFQSQAEQFTAEYGATTEILIGDVVNLDLGLSGTEIKRLLKTITSVHHMAAIYHLGVAPATIKLVNVEGTRAVLRLALEMTKLRRFNHYSTAFVAGNRKGVCLETELDCGQSFRNVYQSTRFAAEKIVRSAMKDLPVSIFRPSIIVGDSRTGEIDKFAGPYYLMTAILNMPLDIHLPLPGKGQHPLNLVPVDYVTKAAAHLSALPETVGMTFHLTDSNPLTARRIYELVAKIAQRKPPKGRIPPFLTKMLLKLPGIERISRPPRQFLDQFNHLSIFNNTNTLRYLEGSGVVCPPFPAYANRLVDFMRRAESPRRAQAAR